MPMALRIGKISCHIIAAFVFLAMFPFSGEDVRESQSFSVFGNPVPTDNPWFAVAAACATLLLLRTAIYIGERRSQRSTARMGSLQQHAQSAPSKENEI